MKQLKNRLQNQQGFTLIELLVVIVIIGILIALLLPNLFSSQQRARDITRKSDIDAVQTSLETYYNDNNAYPAAPGDLVPNYIDEVPEDPQGGAYTYTPAPAGCTTLGDDCDSYTLAATLENADDPADEADGTDDGIYTIDSVNRP